MVDVVRIAEITDVATSHDINLRKWVLAAAGKFPPGCLTALKSGVVERGRPMTFVTRPETLLLIIPSQGQTELSHGGVKTVLAPHDLTSVSPNETVCIDALDETSAFYSLEWTLLPAK
jgi:hypothetical protein